MDLRLRSEHPGASSKRAKTTKMEKMQESGQSSEKKASSTIVEKIEAVALKKGSITDVFYNPCQCVAPCVSSPHGGQNENRR